MSTGWRIVEPRHGRGRRKVPHDPGVYAASISGVTVYVGQSQNLRKRIADHCSAPWYRILGSQLPVVWKIRRVQAKNARLHLEYRLIRRLSPMGNNTGAPSDWHITVFPSMQPHLDRVERKRNMKLVPQS